MVAESQREILKNTSDPYVYCSIVDVTVNHRLARFVQSDRPLARKYTDESNEHFWSREIKSITEEGLVPYKTRALVLYCTITLESRPDHSRPIDLGGGLPRDSSDTIKIYIFQIYSFHFRLSV